MKWLTPIPENVKIVDVGIHINHILVNLGMKKNHIIVLSQTLGEDAVSFCVIHCRTILYQSTTVITDILNSSHMFSPPSLEDN